MLVAIAVNTVGVGLCAWAYSRHWQWERGPLLLMRGAVGVLGVALLCTLTALLVEAPLARGVAAVLAMVALAVAAVRAANAKRRGPLTSVTAAPDAAQHPPRPVQPVRPIRSGGGNYASVTIREIENMEVGP